jgi:hypothetical protein
VSRARTKQGAGSHDASEPLSFLVGCDGGGRWIVMESHGLYGGSFVSKDAAIRYAKFESGDRGAIHICPGKIELKCSS